MVFQKSGLGLCLIPSPATGSNDHLTLSTFRYVVVNGDVELLRVPLVFLALRVEVELLAQELAYHRSLAQREVAYDETEGQNYTRAPQSCYSLPTKRTFDYDWRSAVLKVHVSLVLLVGLVQLGENLGVVLLLVGNAGLLEYQADELAAAGQGPIAQGPHVALRHCKLRVQDDAFKMVAVLFDPLTQVHVGDRQKDRETNSPTSR